MVTQEQFFRQKREQRFHNSYSDRPAKCLFRFHKIFHLHRCRYNLLCIRQKLLSVLRQGNTPANAVKQRHPNLPFQLLNLRADVRLGIPQLPACLCKVPQSGYLQKCVQIPYFHTSPPFSFIVQDFPRKINLFF